MITQEQAQNLKRGDTLYLDGSKNEDGSLSMWRVMGSQNPLSKGEICHIQTLEHGTGVLTVDMLSRVTLGPAFSDVMQDEEAALEPIKQLIAEVAPAPAKKEKQPRQPRQKKEKPAPAPAPEPEADVDEPAVEPSQDNEPE